MLCRTTDKLLLFYKQKYHTTFTETHTVYRARKQKNKKITRLIVTVRSWPPRKHTLLHFHPQQISDSQNSTSSMKIFTLFLAEKICIPVCVTKQGGNQISLAVVCHQKAKSYHNHSCQNNPTAKYVPYTKQHITMPNSDTIMLIDWIWLT